MRCLFCVQRRSIPLRSDPNDILSLANFITIVAALILLGLVSGDRTPESPYWYVSKGEIRQAFESLSYFRRTKIIAARDLCQIYFSRMQGGTGRAQRPTSTSRLHMAEAYLQFWRAMVALAGILLTRNMTAFQDARARKYFQMISDLDEHSLGAHVTIFSLIVMGVLAVRIDKLGRRAALLTLTPLLLLLMQALGSEPDPEDPLSDSFVGQVVYRALYQAGEAVYMVYAAEVFPVQYNGMAPAISSIP